MQQELNIADTYAYAWNTFKQDKKYFFGMVAIFLGVGILEIFIGVALESFNLDYISSSGDFVLDTITELGTATILLHYLNGNKLKLSRLFTSNSRFLSYVGGLLFQWLIVAICVLPFIIRMQVNNIDQVNFLFTILPIPFLVLLYLSMRFSFFIYLLIDQNLSLTDSLATSWQITRGHVLQILAFYLISYSIVLLGILCLVVGSVVALLVIDIAKVKLYRDLLSLKPGCDLGI